MLRDDTWVMRLSWSTRMMESVAELAGVEASKLSSSISTQLGHEQAIEADVTAGVDDRPLADRSLAPVTGDDSTKNNVRSTQVLR